MTTNNLCGSGTTSKQIEGVADCGGIEMSVYPNPAKDDFTVMALPPPPPCDSFSMIAMTESDLTDDAQLLSETSSNRIEIYNSKGNKVYEKEFDGDKLELNGLGLKHGQYHVKMLYKGKVLDERLLITK